MITLCITLWIPVENLLGSPLGSCSAWKTGVFPSFPHVINIAIWPVRSVIVGG